ENLTHIGDIIGTIRYMSPERFHGRCDARSDIYALGLTLYELLAKRPAFDEADRGKLIKQVTDTEPPPLRQLERELPRDLATTVHKAIEREPADRYRTADDLAEELRRFLDVRPIRARRISQAERLRRWCRRNPAVAVLTAAVALLLVGVAVVSTISAVRIAGTRDAAIQAQEKESEQRRRAEENAAESRQRLVRAPGATRT